MTICEQGRAIMQAACGVCEKKFLFTTLFCGDRVEYIFYFKKDGEEHGPGVAISEKISCPHCNSGSLSSIQNLEALVSEFMASI